MVSVQRTGNYVASFGYNQNYRACWVGFVHSAGHYTWEQGSGRSTKLLIFETVGGSSLKRGSAESFFQSGSALNFSQADSSPSRLGKLSI